MRSGHRKHQAEDEACTVRCKVFFLQHDDGNLEPQRTKAKLTPFGNSGGTGICVSDETTKGLFGKLK